MEAGASSRSLPAILRRVLAMEEAAWLPVSGWKLTGRSSSSVATISWSSVGAVKAALIRP